jgi:ribonuclease HII
MSQTTFCFYQDSTLSFFHEEKARSSGHQVIAGVETAGGDALAGPLVISACILPRNFLLEGLNPKLSSAQMRTLYSKILSNPQVVYATSVIEPAELSQLSLFQALEKGVQESVSGLSKKPDLLLSSQIHAAFPSIKSKTLLHGTQFSYSLAVASLIARVTQEAIMEGHNAKWPEYGFSQNKGYSTPQHIKKIELLGPSPVHRSFPV